MKPQVIKVAVIGVGIYPATVRWGIEGTAPAIVGSSILVDPLTYRFAIRQVDGSYLRFVRLVSIPALASACMALGVVGIRISVAAPAVGKFFLMVFGGIPIYGLVMVALDKHVKYGLGATVRTIIATVR